VSKNLMECGFSTWYVCEHPTPGKRTRGSHRSLVHPIEVYCGNPNHRRALVSGRGHLRTSWLCVAVAFRQQQPAKGTEIIQDPAATCNVKVEPAKVIRNQEKCFFSPLSSFTFGGGNFCLHIAPSLVHSFREQSHVFVRTLDIVERSFAIVAHALLSDRLLSGGPAKIVCSLFCHKLQTG